MREYEPAYAGLMGHLAALAGVQVDRIRAAGRERTVQHREIGIAAEPHERGAILGIAGIGEGASSVFETIAQAMQAGGMQDGFGHDFGRSDADRTIREVPIPYGKRRLIKSGQHPKHRAEQLARPPRPHYGQRWPCSTLEFGKDDLVKQIRHEVRPVIGVIMGKQDVRDTVAIHSRLDEIHQRTGTEIQQDELVGLDEIARCGPRRMNIGPGSKNRKMHRSQAWPFSLA